MGLKPKARVAAKSNPLSHSHYDAMVRFAMALPGAEEHFPWGERVAKVRGKVFVFFGHDAEVVGVSGMSVKLPISAEGVLAMPFAKPTGYGLGKSGWCSITSPADQPLPLELLCEWILESYQAIAPKRLLAELAV